MTPGETTRADDLSISAHPTPTRWEQTDSRRGYGAHFSELLAEGSDIFGEARLADVLAPREATILDAGCGMGRTGGKLRELGHKAYGVDLDAELLDQAARSFPELPTLQHRIDLLTPAILDAAGFPTAFDVITLVGNVMILSAPDGERDLLAALRNLLSGNGRLLVGFHTDATPPQSRLYSADEFAADAAAVGLSIDARFGSYELHPYDGQGNYVVHVLSKPQLLA